MHDNNNNMPNQVFAVKTIDLKPLLLSAVGRRTETYGHAANVGVQGTRFFQCSCL